MIIFLTGENMHWINRKEYSIVITLAILASKVFLFSHFPKLLMFLDHLSTKTCLERTITVFLPSLPNTSTTIFL